MKTRVTEISERITYYPELHEWVKNETLDVTTEIHTQKLSVFLFPVDRFRRNATDEQIIADWESNEEYDIPTRKLTPDEFAAECNDEMFADQIYWVRFISI